MEMYVLFKYRDGSNPYIATTYNKVFDMLKKYEYKQIDTDTFMIYGKAKRNFKNSCYDYKKATIEDIAKQWQYDFYKFNYFTSELIDWQSFFYKFGKRFGLLSDFRENGIL